MIILHAQGQTCNKLFTYLNYLADCIESGEKMVILSPDITTKDYTNFIKSEYVKFPFYNQRIAGYLGYKNYIRLLHNILGNKYSLQVLNWFFKIVPIARFVNAPTGSFKTHNIYKYETVLKNVFTPDYSITSEVKSGFDRIKADYDIICGVHIRYGDYRTWLDGKYCYTLNQYHSLMLNIQKIFKTQSVAFLISSNENIDLSVFEGCRCFVIPDSSPTKDVHGLSICDYIIGPPSTFSGWASYYGKTPLYFIEDPNEEITETSFKHISEIWEGT